MESQRQVVAKLKKLAEEIANDPETWEDEEYTEPFDFHVIPCRFFTLDQTGLVMKEHDVDTECWLETKYEKNYDKVWKHQSSATTMVL